MGPRRPSDSPVASQMPPLLPSEQRGTALLFHPDLSYLNEINRRSSQLSACAGWGGGVVIAWLNDEAHHLLSRRLSLTYEEVTVTLGSGIGKVETSAGEAGGGTELNANLFWSIIANVFVKLNREQLVSQCRSI